MKSIEKIIVALIVCSVILGAIPVSGYAKEKKVSNLPGPDTYVSGEVIIKLKSGNSDDEVSKIVSKYNAKSVKKILKDNKKRDKLVEKSLNKFGIERVYILEVSESSDINKLVDKLNRNSDVEYAEPNYIVHIDTNPNDPFFSNLWGLHNTGQTGGTVDADIDAPEAWNIQTGSSDVVIAVIDSGVDYTHPDLVGNIWTNPGETPGDGSDNDGNGYTDDVHGYDFVSNDGVPLDGYGHGTHVAGTIGAIDNNGLGIVGVNWNVAIMPIRFLDNDGSGTTSGAISSIIYAMDNGADILSNSWGGGSYSSSMKNAISAANDAGILFVAAAGNAGTNNDNSPHYPSSYYVPNIISVAATDHNDGMAYFSSYGLKSVDIGAPGVSIYSTVPAGPCTLCDPSGYKSLSGTSMATPHVAGVAGLIKAQFPQYSSDEIKARLLESVDAIPSLNGITVTGGRLNAENSLTIAPVSVLFYDDMEAVGGWTHSGSGDNWENGIPSSGPGSAKSGTNAWATKLDGNYAGNNMDARLTSPSIDLSTVSSAKLTFYHHYNMESTDSGTTGYDGGILEASSNGGSSWTRMAPVGGYLSYISTGYANPLGGESAYSHYSGAGWHYAAFDMSNYAGNSDVKIRFRFATDSSINNYPGWYIDDVTVLGELIVSNDAPVAADDGYNVEEDGTLGVSAPGVLGNDTDADGDALSAVIDTGPSDGTLTLNPDGSFTYTPATNFNGADSFTYHANDGIQDSNIATVSITVNPVSDAPVALDDGYNVEEDGTLGVSAPGVLGNDTDADGDTLSAILDTGPSDGTLTLNPNGSFTYTPFIGFNGSDSFTYHANDGIQDSNVATVSITVNPVNDAPVALDDGYNVEEDGTLGVSAPGVLGNDTDADGDALSAVIDTGPSDGTLTLNPDGSFTYTPAANFNGADSFTYHANDGIQDSNIATVSITVNPVSDAPVALDDGYNVEEDGTLEVSAPGVLGNDTDADGDALSAVLVSPPSSGSVVSLNSNGSFTYEPVAGFNGVDSFTYKAKDPSNAESIPATVTITVQSTEPIEELEFFDGFESGFSNWVQDSQNDWRVSTQRSTDGTYSAEVDGRARDATLTMENGIDLSDKSGATLSFSWFIESSWDNGEYIKLEISTNGISWTELASINGNGGSENQWVDEEIDLSGYLEGNVRIRFKAKVSNSREDGNIDNVRIVSTT